MKTISKNTASAFLFAMLAPFFSLISVAQNISVPPMEGNSILFQADGKVDVTEKINIVLPGTNEVGSITVTVRDERAILEGDIDLGPIAELRSQSEDRGIRVDGANFRWPNATIPYDFVDGFTADYIGLIYQAIYYINGATHLNLVRRTNEASYINFRPAAGCSSFVGRQSQNAAQNVNLMDPNLNNGTGCYFREIMHEIAHAAGLWHEQSREDRNNFVTINWQNVEVGKEHNFNQHIADATDVGPYDFASDMHYSRFAFSANNQPTITAIGGQTFGNATEYSVGDVAAINSMYPTKACPTSHPLSGEMNTVNRALHYEASNTVVSMAVINANSNVTYDGGQLVRLVPGFVAKQGVVFRAAIDGCGGNIQSLAGPEVDEWMHEIAAHQTQEIESGANPTKPAVTALPFDAFPNPATSATTLQFSLPEPAIVSLNVFNLTGKLVFTLINSKELPAGTQQMLCPMSDLAPGVYIARLNAGSGAAILKIVRSSR